LEDNAMLKRLYVDNFKCLVNFEIKLDRLNLLLGDNGSGKTTVFDVIYRLQQFMAGNENVASLFPVSALTRWQSNPLQRFELDLDIEGDPYSYFLVIEHAKDNRESHVTEEKLLMHGKPLYIFQKSTAQIFRDNYSPYEIPFEWVTSQSGVGVFANDSELKRLNRFRKEMAKFIVASINPMAISPESKKEESNLSRNMDNFVSWYRFLSQEHQGTLMKLFEELKEVLPGFHSFSIREAGEEVRVMKVLLERGEGNGKPIPYGILELSEGQRVLIILYSLLHGLKDEGVYLFLDEPDNYIALREIQPWLTALADSCGRGIAQAVLISHHPEVIDYLAIDSGKWFERDSNGPARVSDSPRGMAEGLKPSENVARGWNT
jgi:predicted ATPase